MPTVYLSAVPERLLPGYLDPKGTMQISKIKEINALFVTSKIEFSNPRI